MSMLDAFRNQRNFTEESSPLHPMPIPNYFTDSRSSTPFHDGTSTLSMSHGHWNAHEGYQMDIPMSSSLQNTSRGAPNNLGEGIAWIIGQASADDLVKHRNSAYIEVKTQFDTLMDAYNALVKAIPSAVIASGNPLGLDISSSQVSIGLSSILPGNVHGPLSAEANEAREVVMKSSGLRYYKESDYNTKSLIDGIVSLESAVLDLEPAASGKTKTLAYIEEKDGRPVGPDRLELMRASLRELFQELLKHNNLPEKWGKRTSTQAAYIKSEMYRKYPELGFCEGDWKLNKLTSQTLSYWRNTHKNKQTNKRLPVSEPLDTAPRRPTKHARTNLNAPPLSERTSLVPLALISDIQPSTPSGSGTFSVPNPVLPVSSTISSATTLGTNVDISTASTDSDPLLQLARLACSTRPESPALTPVSDRSPEAHDILEDPSNHAAETPMATENDSSLSSPQPGSSIPPVLDARSDSEDTSTQTPSLHHSPTEPLSNSGPISSHRNVHVPTGSTLSSVSTGVASASLVSTEPEVVAAPRRCSTRKRLGNPLDEVQRQRREKDVTATSVASDAEMNAAPSSSLQTRQLPLEIAPSEPEVSNTQARRGRGRPRGTAGTVSEPKTTPFRPGSALTARNLYGKEFMKERGNKKKTTAEFDAVWCTLPEGIKEDFQARADNLRRMSSEMMST